MQDFKNLTVWQMARQLTKSIYKLTMDFPGIEKDRQLRRLNKEAAKRAARTQVTPLRADS
jgi:hypothetical protein